MSPDRGQTVANTWPAWAGSGSGTGEQPVVSVEACGETEQDRKDEP